MKESLEFRLVMALEKLAEESALKTAISAAIRDLLVRRDEPVAELNAMDLQLRKITHHSDVRVNELIAGLWTEALLEKAAGQAVDAKLPYGERAKLAGVEK